MSSTAIACPSCKAALKLTQAPKGKIRCPRCKAVFAPHASAEDQTLPPSTPPRSQATQAVTVPPHPAPRETESNYVSPSPRSDDTLGQVADNGPDLSELEGLLSPAKGPGELGWLGPYRVLKILGQGGMGVVFLAEDPALERRVALKAMLPKIARNASAKDRFLREARAAAKLKHEHIVAIHQVGEDRGIPFLAIEFLEGEALDTCLGREGTLPIPEVLRIGKQIAEGLAAAHEQHLIHRDIKPANVWLERRKGRKATVVKILDFGLAKKTNDEHHLTQSGMIIGTPAYMPPEQAGAGAVDHRADLYSLGVVLYKMVTGEVPFTGRDTMALLSALALQAPTPPVERNPNVPAELNSLILKLLAKKPEDRPQSAEEVAAALEAIAAPTEIASPSVSAKLAADPNRTQGFASAVTTKTANTPRKRWPMAMIGLLLLGFATTATLVFSGLIRIGTSDGDFVLDTDDPDFAFSVSKDKVLLDDKKTKRQYQLKVLAQKDGQYELEMTDADAGLTFHSKTITIRRGDKVALKAWFERKGGEAKFEPKTLPPTFKNSLGMEFVLVPKGTGWLGGGGGKPGDKKVDFEQDFYLGKYEVTQEEWEKVTGLNPSHFSRSGKGNDTIKDISDADLKRFPVETVSWDDCQLFVERLNKQMKESGWVYRLPTEAEWEYAYRGGPVDRFESAFHFYFEKPSNEFRDADANFGQVFKTTRKVGSYKPNRLGLYDMFGNVFEWCADAVPNPKNTSDNSYRVFRGGSWWNGKKDFSINARYPAPPNYSSTGGGGTMGLRLARVPVVKDTPVKIDPTQPNPVAATWKPIPFGQSPFDKLDPKEIPAAERFDWQPKELVAVIGSQANRRHFGPVSTIDISPDGTKALTTDGYGVFFKVWDLATRQPIRNLQTPQLTELGNMAYFVSDKQVLTRNLYSLDLTKPNAPPSPLFADETARKAFLQGGTLLQGTSADGSLWLYRKSYLSNQEPNQTQPGDVGARLSLVDGSVRPPKVIAELPHRGFRADMRGGKLMYSDLKDQIHLADITRDGFTNDRVLKLPDEYKTVPFGISPSGKKAAFSLPTDKTRRVEIWDVSGDEPRLLSTAQGPAFAQIYPFQFSLNEHFLAFRDGGGGDGHFLLDIRQARARSVPETEGNRRCTSLAFTPDSQTLIVGDAYGRVRFWDITQIVPMEREPRFDPGTAFPHEQSQSNCAHVIGDVGQVVVNRFDPAWQSWDLSGKRPEPGPVMKREGHILGVANSRSFLRSTRKVYELFSFGKGTWQQQAVFGNGADEHNLGLSPDGSLAVTRNEQELIGWDLTVNPPSQIWKTPLGTGLHAQQLLVAPIRISADNRRMAVLQTKANGVRGIQLFQWEGNEMKPSHFIEVSNVQGCAFSPDGRSLAVIGFGFGRIVDTASPKPVENQRFKGGFWVAYHPSGRWIATADTSARTVSIRAVPDGKVVQQWQFPGDVRWVDFAPDGRHLFTHNPDGTVYVLRITLDDEQAVAPVEPMPETEPPVPVGKCGEVEVGGPYDLALSPEGDRLTAQRGNNLNLISSTSPRPKPASTSH